MVVPTNNIVDPYRAYAEKPNADNWSKEKPNFVCPIVLQRKQAYQYGASHREFYICTRLSCNKSHINMVSCMVLNSFKLTKVAQPDINETT
jgi:hypothetical protein